jgi:hypothetical protein
MRRIKIFTGVLAGSLAVACGRAEPAEGDRLREQAAARDTSMRAAVVRQWGPPDALRIEPVPRPEAGPDRSRRRGSRRRK